MGRGDKKVKMEEVAFDDLRHSTQVLERIAPRFVREPSTVARLRGKFAAFYGAAAPPPLKKAYQESLNREALTEERNKTRSVVRRERVNVVNVPDQVGVGKHMISRWVDRVDPASMPACATSKPTHQEEKVRPIDTSVPLVMFRGSSSPWGRSEQEDTSRNKSPLTVGCTLRALHHGRFPEALLYRDNRRPPRLKLPKASTGHTDSSNMPPAGFRTSDRYIF